jgi:hypothetical protein
MSVRTSSSEEGEIMTKMQRVAIAIAAVAFVAGAAACSGKGAAKGGEAVGPKLITAVWGTTVAKKPVAKALAKTNGPNQVAFYVYSFPAVDTYPDGAAYKPDDFFLEAAVDAGAGKTIVPGTYSGDQITSLVIHTKEMNVVVGKPTSSIVITQVGNGRIEGEFKIDDGSAKLSGPFEMDLL